MMLEKAKAKARREHVEWHRVHAEFFREQAELGELYLLQHRDDLTFEETEEVEESIRSLKLKALATDNAECMEDH